MIEGFAAIPVLVVSDLSRIKSRSIQRVSHLHLMHLMIDFWRSTVTCGSLKKTGLSFCHDLMCIFRLGGLCFKQTLLWAYVKARTLFLFSVPPSSQIVYALVTTNIQIGSNMAY